MPHGIADGDAARMSDFWALHAGLPRQAPGSDVTTRRMFDALDAPAGARAVDIGCGPGRASLVLAAAGLDVLAVDTHQPFLDELDTAARAAGVRDRIRTCNAPMEALPLADASVDVVWSEGAAYIMGFGEALTSWSQLLAPGGGLAVTECCWLTDRPSSTATRFWSHNYPRMQTVAGTRALIESCGLAVVGHWTLPDTDWWDEYYGSIAARLDELDPQQRSDDAVRRLQHELEVRSGYGDEYGYVAFVLRP